MEAMDSAVRTFALLAAIVLTSEAFDYCSLCKEHTMCSYQESKATCQNVNIQGVDAGNQQLIVDIHNRLRSIVATGKETMGRSGPQPPASNMRALTWDNELAEIAQRWANKCQFGHDVCRNVQRFSVGQNVFMSYSSGGNPKSEEWEEAINSWYNEVKSFNRNDVKKFKLSSFRLGHYTQLVWAETSRVGCGFVSYNKNRMIHKYYVCNYGKAGNWLGEKLYEIGSTCSLCPQGTYCNVQGLCY